MEQLCMHVHAHCVSVYAKPVIVRHNNGIYWTEIELSLSF